MVEEKLLLELHLISCTEVFTRDFFGEDPPTLKLGDWRTKREESIELNAYLEDPGAPLFIGKKLESYPSWTLTIFRVCRSRLIWEIYFLLWKTRSRRTSLSKFSSLERIRIWLR